MIQKRNTIFIRIVFISTFIFANFQYAQVAKKRDSNSYF